MNKCGKTKIKVEGKEVIFICCWCKKKQQGDKFLQYIEDQHCQKCENPKSDD